MEIMKLKPSDYWYHWGIIKKENKLVYDKLTEENIREDIERTIQGIEQKIQELQTIINDETTEKSDRIRAIETQAELMASIPRMRQQGGAFIAQIESGDTDRGKQEKDTEAPTGQ